MTRLCNRESNYSVLSLDATGQALEDVERSGRW